MSLVSVFIPLLRQKGFAITKLLSKFEPMSFTELKNSLGCKNAKLDQYLRKFRKLGIIETDSINKLNRLTPRGKQMLVTIEETFPEKFISENEDEICCNSVSSEHSFTLFRSHTVCKNCAYTSHGDLT